MCPFETAGHQNKLLGVVAQMDNTVCFVTCSAAAQVIIDRPQNVWALMTH